MPSRIEREIEEILIRLDEFVPEKRRSGRFHRFRRRLAGVASGAIGRLRSATGGITGGHVVLIASLVLVAGLVLNRIYPTVALWAMVGSLLVLFGAIFASIRGPRGPTRASRYWRGQPLDMRGPSLAMRLRMWWRRRNRPRP